LTETNLLLSFKFKNELVTFCTFKYLHFSSNEGSVSRSGLLVADRKTPVPKDRTLF